MKTSSLVALALLLFAGLLLTQAACTNNDFKRKAEAAADAFENARLKVNEDDLTFKLALEEAKRQVDIACEGIHVKKPEAGTPAWICDDMFLQSMLLEHVHMIVQTDREIRALGRKPPVTEKPNLAEDIKLLREEIERLK
jgi:hypothetical protein